jgi:hypothetical protein
MFLESVIMDPILYTVCVCVCVCVREREREREKRTEEKRMFCFGFRSQECLHGHMDTMIQGHAAKLCRLSSSAESNSSYL